MFRGFLAAIFRDPPARALHVRYRLRIPAERKSEDSRRAGAADIRKASAMAANFEEEQALDQLTKNAQRGKRPANSPSEPQH